MFDWIWPRRQYDAAAERKRILERYDQFGRNAAQEVVLRRVAENMKQLVESQQPLGKEFEEVLYKNLWDLYGE